MAGKPGATPLTALGLCFFPLGGGQDSPAHPLGASGFDALWFQMLPQPPSASLPPLPHALPNTALQCQSVAPVAVMLTTHSGLLSIIHAPEEEREYSAITCTSEHLPWGVHSSSSDNSKPSVTHSGSLWLGSVICWPDQERRESGWPWAVHQEEELLELDVELVFPTLCPRWGCLDWRVGSDGSQTWLESPAGEEGTGR